MYAKIKPHLFEFISVIALIVGFATIVKAQTTDNQFQQEAKKKVRVEVEVTENGETSISTQEYDLNTESIDGRVEEMVEEIEMILEDAVNDIEETDLEIIIRRNANDIEPEEPHFRSFIGVIPEQPINHFEHQGAFLGVYAEGLYEDELDELNVEEAIKIKRVVEGTAAQEAELNVGDIVYEIDGEPIGSFEELAQVIKSHQPGDEVELRVLHNGEEQTKSVVLRERKRQEVRWEIERKAFLGVEGSTDNGARIDRVVEESAAGAAGIKAGDVITAIDGNQIESFGDLAAEIKSKNPGESISMEVVRDGKKEVVEAVLKEKISRQYSSNPVRYHYNYAKSSCDDSKSNKAFLGVIAKNMDDKGIEITKVIEGSAAEKAGLSEGDIIRKIDGEKIQSVDGLVAELSMKDVEEEIEIDIERDGKKASKNTILGNRADHQKAIGNYGKSETRKIVMRFSTEELSEEEIAELNKKSGANVDATNSLELDNFQFSPNPTTGEFRIGFESAESGDLRINLFDQNGRKVIDINVQDFSGSYSNTINIGEEPSGVYFLTVNQNDKSKTARLVKQ